MSKAASKADDEAFLRGLTQEQSARRKRDLAAIHTAKRKLGLADGQYRDLLEAWTGRRSAKYMRAKERGDVIENFRKMGFEKKGEQGDDAAPEEPDDEGRPLPPEAARADAVEQAQHKKIVHLWRALYQAGQIDDPTMSALCSFCTRQTGIQHVRWLPPRDANTVIESLKQWIQREKTTRN
jgi:phage gp16-like protein